MAVRICLHTVWGCPRLHTLYFPLLQFLGLPVIDMLNDTGLSGQLIIRDSQDLLPHLLLSGVICLHRHS